MQLLVELGADVGAAADASGMAALHRAAARSHAGVLRRLLAVGADPWQRSAAGQAPLMYASQFGHEEAVAALLQHLEGCNAPGAGAAHEPALGASEADMEQGRLQAGQAAGAAGSAGTAAAGAPAGAAAGEGGASGSALARHLALTDGAGLTALHLAAQWGMAGVAEQLLAAGLGELACVWSGSNGQRSLRHSRPESPALVRDAPSMLQRPQLLQSRAQLRRPRLD